MANTKVFKRGLDYPNEGFIQNKIEEYFTQLGYEPIEVDYSDYVCIHPSSNAKWVIEAKGKTSAIGLDFRTCLGQVVQRMDLQTTNYAVAIPDLESYIKQCNLIKPWVRKVLNLYWIIVDADGNVKVISPEEEIE